MWRIGPAFLSMWICGAFRGTRNATKEEAGRTGERFGSGHERPGLDTCQAFRVYSGCTYCTGVHARAHILPQ